MTTYFADHLPSGDHASRPAATAVPEGALYSCSDHDLIYQSDGATWSTWATVGGSAGGSGSELDYVQVSSGSVTVSGTSEGAATTVVTGGSIALDGSTSVMVEFFSPRVNAAGGAQTGVLFDLYDGATLLGRIAVFLLPNAGGNGDMPVVGRRRLATPSNGSHQYIVKAWRSGTSGSVYGGAGGTGAQLPLFLRVTKV